MSTFEKELSSENTDTPRTAQGAKLHEKGEQHAHIPTCAEIASSELWRAIQAWSSASLKPTLDEEVRVLRQEVQQQRNQPLPPLLGQHLTGWRSKALYRHLHLIQSKQIGDDQRRSMSDRQRR